jgi:hypothetical protein
MLMVLLAATLVVLTTLMHYEALRLISAWLVRLRMPQRAKLVVVILGAFLAHTLEIALYGLTIYGVIRGLGMGSLGGNNGPMTLDVFMYFSAETYTSIGYGDLVPQGPARMLAGVEALNGLLLIGWTSSFAYVAMAEFWSTKPSPNHPQSGRINQ